MVKKKKVKLIQRKNLNPFSNFITIKKMILFKKNTPLVFLKEMNQEI